MIVIGKYLEGYPELAARCGKATAEDVCMLIIHAVPRTELCDDELEDIERRLRVGGAVLIFKDAPYAGLESQADAVEFETGFESRVSSPEGSGRRIHVLRHPYRDLPGESPTRFLDAIQALEPWAPVPWDILEPETSSRVPPVVGLYVLFRGFQMAERSGIPNLSVRRMWDSIPSGWKSQLWADLNGAAPAAHSAESASWQTVAPVLLASLSQGQSLPDFLELESVVRKLRSLLPSLHEIREGYLTNETHNTEKHLYLTAPRQSEMERGRYLSHVWLNGLSQKTTCDLRVTSRNVPRELRRSLDDVYGPDGDFVHNIDELTIILQCIDRIFSPVWLYSRTPLLSLPTSVRTPLAAATGEWWAAVLGIAAFKSSALRSTRNLELVIREFADLWYRDGDLRHDDVEARLVLIRTNARELHAVTRDVLEKGTLLP